MSDAEPADESLIIAGKYRLGAELGRGGMGAVYAAEHTLTGRRLAVKLLLPQFAQNDQLARRFINEARAATSIQDPHVVEVVDLGRSEGGELFQVLEFLDGRDLKAAVRAEAPFPLERAAHILEQVARTMGRAHARNIVHRDLKPANVFLIERDGDRDYAKVLDFGIAKLRPQGDAGAEHTQLTRTNDVVGTPLYMAPEQLKGSRDVDPRADVYSMGVMLYQMLAAELPFVGDSMADIYLKVMTEASRDILTARPDLDPAVQALIARAMHRDPAERFPTGTELADALAPYAAGWSRNTPRTAPGYAPGARGPVGGTTPGHAARPAAGAPALVASTPSAVVTAPPAGARPSRAALVAVGVVLAVVAAVAGVIAGQGSRSATATTATLRSLDVVRAPVAPPPPAAPPPAAVAPAVVPQVPPSAPVVVAPASPPPDPRRGTRVRHPTTHPAAAAATPTADPHIELSQ